MRTLCFALLIAVCPWSLAAAETRNSSFSLSLVNSVDEVGFNIAADLSGTSTPNVLSDLHWDDMDIWHLEGALRYRFGEHLTILTDFRIGAIREGDATDRDFLGDNRTLEFSRSTATVDGKHHLQGAAGIGWRFQHGFKRPLWLLGNSSRRLMLQTDIHVTPTVGYGYAKQEIRFEDGVQLIPDLGPFDGLSSAYDTQWRGLFVGLEGRVQVWPRVYLTFDARYFPDLNFDAAATWNLRSDLNQPTSFKHSAEADGLDVSAGLDWHITSSKTLGLAYQDIKFKSDPGVDQVITAQGIHFFTRLNEARWKSSAWLLTFRWRF